MLKYAENNIINAWIAKLAVTSLIIWMLLTFFYINLAKNNSLSYISDIILFMSQLVADIAIVCLSCKLLHKSSNKFKIIFSFLCLAFALQTITDSNVNITIHFFNHYPLSLVEELSIETPFFIFQVTLFITFIEIIKASDFSLGKQEIFSVVNCLPFLIVISTVLYFFIFSYDWEIEFFSTSGILQIILVILDLFIFLISLLVLAATHRLTISLIAAGTLVLVTNDIIERFSILTTTYTSDVGLSHMLWSLGLIIIAFGLLILNMENPTKNSKYQLLLPVRSIQVQYTLWCFLISIFSISAFILIIETFADYDYKYHNLMVKTISSILIIFSAFSVLFSKFFSKKLSKPFQNMIPALKKVSNDNCTESELLEIIENDKSGILEINRLSKFIVKAFHNYKDKVKAETKLTETAIQVAHDIRSPLASLEIIINELPNIPNDQKIIIDKCTRNIHQIADNLLDKHRNNKTTGKIKYCFELISNLVKDIFYEKQIQFKNSIVKFKIFIAENANNLFANIPSIEFQRVLSNILNNAIEATKNKNNPSIKIEVLAQDNKILIKITDNGNGIPIEILNDIKSGSKTTNKPDGNGLGLYHANNVIKKYCKGDLIFESQVGAGTTVTIVLPVAELKYDSHIDLIFIDNDTCLTDAWKLQASTKGKKIFTFNSILYFRTVLHNFNLNTPIYIDQDLNDVITGIEFSKELYQKGFHNLYLATGYDPKTFDQCSWLKGVVGKTPCI